MNNNGKKQLKIELLKNDMNVFTFAKKMNMSVSTLYRKLDGTRSDFTLNELKLARAVLHLTFEEWFNVFFAPDDPIPTTNESDITSLDEQEDKKND